VRVVLDANVIVSAALSPGGTPARLIRRWQRGDFEQVASPHVVAEQARALAYPKLRTLIDREQATELVEWIERSATVVPDPDREPPVRSPDPGDDYLLALAQKEGAALISGDGHLVGLGPDVPVFSPANFLRLLDRR
jgi:putative PIN family toxin of toxin-antitoxin system